jgi:dolichol kinase
MMKSLTVFCSGRNLSGLGGFGRNKGILGFLGGALACVPFNYRIFSMAKSGAGGLPGGRASLLLASVALGVAGSLADLAVPTPAITLPKKICGVTVPPLHVDDNFVVPIVSGFACTRIFKAVAWHQNLEFARFIFV